MAASRQGPTAITVATTAAASAMTTASMARLMNRDRLAIFVAFKTAKSRVRSMTVLQTIEPMIPAAMNHSSTFRNPIVPVAFLTRRFRSPDASVGVKTRYPGGALWTPWGHDRGGERLDPLRTPRFPNRQDRAGQAGEQRAAAVGPDNFESAPPNATR